MKVNGADLSAYEMAMRETVLGVVVASLKLDMPGCNVQEAESGGFPTIAVKIDRIASVSVPVVTYKADARVGTEWLSRQSRPWATKYLSRAVVRVASAMARAVTSRPGGFSCACIDRSSVSASFEAIDDGFLLRFSVGVASYPVPDEDGIVVDVDRKESFLGTFDIDSDLPDEIKTRVEEFVEEISQSDEMNDIVNAMYDMLNEDIYVPET